MKLIAPASLGFEPGSGDNRNFTNIIFNDLLNLFVGIINRVFKGVFDFKFGILLFNAVFVLIYWLVHLMILTLIGGPDDAKAGPASNDL